MEYEALPKICFKCGMFGHVTNGCLGDATSTSMETSDGVKHTMEVSSQDKKVEEEPFGSWMVVEHLRGRGCVSEEERDDVSSVFFEISRFMALIDNQEDIMGEIVGENNGRGEVSNKIMKVGENGKNLRFLEKGKEPKGKQAKQRAPKKKRDGI